MGCGRVAIHDLTLYERYVRSQSDKPSLEERFQRAVTSVSCIAAAKDAAEARLSAARERPVAVITNFAVLHHAPFCLIVGEGDVRIGPEVWHVVLACRRA